MITNILRLIHSSLILYIFYSIFTTNLCCPRLAIAQIILTITLILLQKRLNSNRTKLSIILSFILGYTLFSNKFNNIGLLFFIKSIQVHLYLRDLRNSIKTCNQYSLTNYLLFVYDLLRFYINQFTLLWITCIIYRYLCDQIHQPIPETHKLLYQLVVTASTIGFGDVTPRSEIQIIFFTVAIPILCSSFVIFINSLVDIYTNTFMLDEKKEQVDLDHSKNL